MKDEGQGTKDKRQRTRTRAHGATEPLILQSVDYDATRSVLTALERHGVRYAVFGAVALNLHGVARFAEDLDLSIEPDRSNIDRLVLALKDVFADPTLDEISADDLPGEYPAIQYVPPQGTFRLDLLTRLGEASPSGISRSSAFLSTA